MAADVIRDISAPVEATSVAVDLSAKISLVTDCDCQTFIEELDTLSPLKWLPHCEQWITPP